MSINNSNNGSGVIIFNGERLLIYYNHCELKIDKYSPSCNLFAGTKNGSVYLTSHRIIFINKNLNERLQSLSMPFVTLKHVDIKQPIFGANKVEGDVIAEPNGGFQGMVHFSITFNHGGAIEFGQALLEAGRRTTQGRGAWIPNENFFSIPVGAAYYAAPAPAYAPPYYDPYYNFIPQHESFVAPNGSQIFMYGAPPPYPGACPYPVNETPSGMLSYHNQGIPNQGAPNYKEMEANSQSQPPGYFNVYNPHDVYVSNGNNGLPGYQAGAAPSAPPPAYSDIEKKTK